MPRKKVEKRFKYTIRKNGVLYVRYPVSKLKAAVWSKCEIETQEEVSRIIGEIIATEEREKQAQAAPETCKDFFAFFLESVKSRVSERTLQKYEQVIKLYLAPSLGNLQLNEVKLVHIQNIYQTMSDRALSPLTVKKAHSTASVIFKEALNLDLIPLSPVARAKTPKLKLTEKVKFMSAPEVKRFLAECQKSDYGIIFEFALETGMRPQEYLALR